MNIEYRHLMTYSPRAIQADAAVGVGHAEEDLAGLREQPIQRQHSASRTERLSASHSQAEAVELTNLDDLIRFV